MAEEKILDRVAKLLERANHKDANPNERDSCLKKADALMAQHQIDAAMLDARNIGKSAPSAPVMGEAVFVNREDEFFGVLAKVAGAFLGLCKIKGIVQSGYKRDDAGLFVYENDMLVMQTTLKLCGFADDVEYFRMLWTGAFLVFSSKLYPRWDNAHTLARNIRTQKEAGTKWGSIYDLAKANGWSGYRRPGKVSVDEPSWGPYGSELNALGAIEVGRCPADKGYFKKLYELQCKLDVVEATNHTQRNAAYRESYAYGFLAEIQTRIMEMQRIRNQNVARTGGAEVALRDRSQIVLEEFRKMFPSSESIQVYRQHGTEDAGSAAGHVAGKNVDLLGGRNRMGGEKRALEG